MAHFPRDNQRARLYAAEQVLEGRRVSRYAAKHLIDTEPFSGRYGVKIPSTKAIQAYVDDLTTSAWFVRRWGVRRIDYQNGRGSHATSGGFLGSPTITIAQEHRRTEAVILHEIAHCLAPWFDAQPHGPEFAAIYLTLVRGVMGAESGKDLSAAFADRRVKYRNGLTIVPKPDAERWERSRPALARRRAAKR